MRVPELTLNIQGLAPLVREDFTYWARFLKKQINFTRPESPLHSYAHEERVLLYALILADSILPENAVAREILAHAAVFHDTRRKDDPHDTGHGAWAAVHYKKFCEKNGLNYYPEAAAIMRYHDMDDSRGKKQIAKHFSGESGNVASLYDIFKDADALDRWRLGPKGLDPGYLRTNEARQLADFAKKLIAMSSQ